MCLHGYRLQTNLVCSLILQSCLTPLSDSSSTALKQQIGYVHTRKPSDGKISDRIARGRPRYTATNSGAFWRCFTVRINPISMGLISAMAAIVVFDAVSAWKLRQE